MQYIYFLLSTLPGPYLYNMIANYTLLAFFKNTKQPYAGVITFIWWEGGPTIQTN